MSVTLDTVVSLCKRRGFLFPSSEVYGGLAATYDYGPLGAQLKRNVKDRWWNAVVKGRADVEGLDAAILMHPTVWKASGHVDAFSDPLIDDKQSQNRYRADQLVEGHIDKLRRKGKDEQADAVYERLVAALNSDDLPAALHRLILDEEIRSPDSGAFDWTDVRQFNLMFETHVGPASDSESKVYLRPETAQGIFVNFHNVRETTRQSIPFGIGQIGKAFRNEIVARQFIFRMREFEQMEMQWFCAPGTQMEWFEKWSAWRMDWHAGNGVRPSKLRWHGHEKLAHYADAAQDVQYEYPMGWQEVEGVHSRTDYDLARHQEFSGKKMEYFDPQSQERYVPYVVETSVGLDRTVLMLLCEAYDEDSEGGDERVVMRFHPDLAPITAAVFPLIKKGPMAEFATRLEADLRALGLATFYDAKGSIGKRYRRMDEAGTPFCLTVDGETVEEGEQQGTVTVRDRDTLEQTRVPAERLAAYLTERMRGWTREG